MIRINLLPHREAAKKARREQFYFLLGLVITLGVLGVLAVYSLIEMAIEKQDSKNSFLRAELAVLDKQLEQIKRLKEQTQALLARKQVIENLQRDRGETVHLLSELVLQVPDGVYIRSLKQDGLRVNITGIAQSNARISSLMRNIEFSQWLERPQLVESKATIVNGRRSNEFVLNFALTRATPEDGKGK